MAEKAVYFTIRNQIPVHRHNLCPITVSGVDTVALRTDRQCEICQRVAPGSLGKGKKSATVGNSPMLGCVQLQD